MNQERIYQVLMSPHISEKSSVCADLSNQYVFKVARDANKPEIKKAVEALFDVQVGGVQVVNVKGKTKRSRTTMTRRSDWKKAYVTLKEGQEIDFLESAD